MAANDGTRHLDHDYGAIYETVFDFGGHAPWFPAPWQHIAPPLDARGAIADIDAAVAVLRKRFSDALLRDAGIMVPCPNGSDRLNPFLTDPEGAILPLRRKEYEHPIALLTAGGCLPQRGCALDYALSDNWIRTLVAQTGKLFVTPNTSDVLLLRSLDIAATLTDGLPRLQPDELLDRVEKFNRINVDHLWPQQYLPKLILVGWSMTTMDARPPAALQTVVDAMAAVNDVSLSLLNPQAWTMDADRLESLRLTLDTHIGDESGELVIGHIATIPYKDVFFPPAGPVSSYPDTLMEALDAEAAADDTGRSRRRVVQARGAHLHAIKTGFIAPLEASAAAAPNPLVQAALTYVADAAKKLHELTPTVIHEYRRGRPISAARCRALRQYARGVREFARLMPLVAKARQVKP